MPKKRSQTSPPRSCNITGVMGASQTGKGLYCHARLRLPYRGITAVWSTLERTDQYGPWLGVQAIDRGTGRERIRALIAAIRSKARAIVYVPAADELAEQFDWFCRAMWECPAPRVLVEELSRVTTPSYAPLAWANLSTAGAHQDLELIATAQFPAQIDKAFLGNCTELRVYRLNEKRHAVVCAEKLFPDRHPLPWRELVMLPNRHYFHRWIQEIRTESGVQPTP